MIEINPNVLYTRDDLLGLFGRAALEAARRAGLYAVADLYLGQSVLDNLRRAHNHKTSQRVTCRKGDCHEKKAVAQNTKHPAAHAASSGQGAADVLRALEKA